MEIDIKTIEYDVELSTEDGGNYILNDAIIRLEWEEQEKELAQRATLTVANFIIGNTYLMSLMKINCRITIYGKWNAAENTGGSNRDIVFQGVIWEWQYLSATQKELTVVAYDPLIHLQQSKDFRYYSSGMTTKDIINDICQGTDHRQPGWGIPYLYKWNESITHEKKVMNGEKISDMIIGLLEEVCQKTGEKYVAQYRDNQLVINYFGTNSPVYKFDIQNAISTSNKLTINNLVTRVKVIGKQDDDGRAPIDALLEGDIKYGVLQEIVLRDGDKTIEAAKAEAAAILKERGKAAETIQINVPDVPFMRKGDKIEVLAGNLIGFFYIIGVTHNATARQMALTLERLESL